jgi:hypothetical protein
MIPGPFALSIGQGERPRPSHTLLEPFIAFDKMIIAKMTTTMVTNGNLLHNVYLSFKLQASSYKLGHSAKIF